RQQRLRAEIEPARRDVLGLGLDGSGWALELRAASADEPRVACSSSRSGHSCESNPAAERLACLRSRAIGIARRPRKSRNSPRMPKFMAPELVWFDCFKNL